jgi:hypothetical protein
VLLHSGSQLAHSPHQIVTVSLQSGSFEVGFRARRVEIVDDNKAKKAIATAVSWLRRVKLASQRKELECCKSSYSK